MRQRRVYQITGWRETSTWGDLARSRAISHIWTSTVRAPWPAHDSTHGEGHIHCSATHPGMDIGADTIDKLHKQRGFRMIGYHEVVRRNGLIELGRMYNQQGAHAKGHNKDSLAICLIGGVDDLNKPEDNFTDAQHTSLKQTLRHKLLLYPDATIHGHNEVSEKACPSFDVQEWLQANGFEQT